MVVGKAGDTVAIATHKIEHFSPIMMQELKREKTLEKDKIHYQYQEKEEKVKVFRIQEASGIIGTTQTAVEIYSWGS